MKSAAPRRLDRVDLWRVAVGGLFLQAVFNTERRQALGFATAMIPAARLWPKGPARVAFFRRHLENFNTNPAMAGPILGAVARLEERASAGDAEAAQRIPRFKKAVEGPFAALGDELLWKGFRTGGAVWGCALAWVAGALGPVAFLVVYNALHLGLRMGGVFWGYREGENAHRILQVPSLVRLRRIAPAVALTGLLATLIVVFAGENPGWGPVFLGLACGAGAAFAGSRGIAHGTPVVLGAIIIGLVAALWRA